MTRYIQSILRLSREGIAVAVAMRGMLAGILANLLMIHHSATALPPVTYDGGGPGWDADSISLATVWGSRRGEDPGRQATPATLRQLHLGLSTNPPQSNRGAGLNGTQHGAASFSFDVPLIHLPGRGIDLAVNMHYDSHLWYRSGETMVFDAAADWPAPGFQLGFGRIIAVSRTPSNLGPLHFLVEPDGTIRPSTESYRLEFERGYRTIDSSMIDYKISFDALGNMRHAVARYPDGTEIQYEASNPSQQSTLFASNIIDVHGNSVRIRYRTDAAPAIYSIEDTLGRIVRFHYDGDQHLTAITAPAYGGTGERTLARLNYAVLGLDLKNAFASPLQARARNCTAPPIQPCPLPVLASVVYPGSGSGYLLAGGYSTYGVLTRVSERRGMAVAATSLEEQGTTTSGDSTREREYNYPRDPSKLSDVPAYTSMVERWLVKPAAGANPGVYGSATYGYQVDPENRVSVVALPSGGRIVHTAHKNPGQVDDGLPATDETFSADGTRLLAIRTEWEGDDENHNPRRTRVETTNERGHTANTHYDYDPKNQVIGKTEID
jgi:YD repeat-containing protein